MPVRIDSDSKLACIPQHTHVSIRQHTSYISDLWRYTDVC
jgi:hypothetical protein